MALYENKDYLNPIPYLWSTSIREYDIAKANINILHHYGVIDDSEYVYLNNLPRMDRQYAIGMKQKDPKVDSILKNGIAEFRKRFCIENGIQDNNIFSIKNDAIFVMDINPIKTVFDDIEFVNKNNYISYMNLMGLELYYSLDRIRQKEYVTVKGINDTKVELYHYNYFLDFIIYIFNAVQTQSIEEAINALSVFYKKYMNKELDIGYYREFNSGSMYRLMNTNFSIYDIGIENVNKKYIDCINISYNAKLLTLIWSYLSTTYYDRKRRM